MAKADKEQQPMELSQGEIWALIRAAYASSFPYLLITVVILALATFFVTRFPSLISWLLSAILVVGLLFWLTRAIQGVLSKDNQAAKK